MSVWLLVITDVVKVKTKCKQINNFDNYITIILTNTHICIDNSNKLFSKQINVHVELITLV